MTETNDRTHYVASRFVGTIEECATRAHAEHYADTWGGNVFSTWEAAVKFLRS
jgi:hypothetical protein